MAALKTVKACLHCCTVGVITRRAELLLATKMAQPPDLFELRLDHLVKIADLVETKMSILRAPFIITARNPAEGGANNLSLRQRRELLLRFLPAAHYVDLELRSAAALKPVLALARKKNVKRIISFHDFNSTPTIRTLMEKARAAKRLGADIFKVAIRTDSAAQLDRLLQFAANVDVDLAISAMGMGKLGRESRRKLMHLGSVLIYGHIGRTRIAGQPSLAEIQRWTLSVES